ncbi:MAG: cofilin [Geoglossum simile]|nr:MAG: cofilin [Geoglossum simile]
MTSSGIKVSDDSLTQYEELKAKGLVKYIIYKIDSTESEVLPEEGPKKDPTMSNKEAWKDLLSHLGRATSIGRDGKSCAGPRYVAFDFEYQAEDNGGRRQKIALISYCPDGASVRWKTLHSSSLQIISAALKPPIVIQVNGMEDLEYERVLLKVDNKAKVEMKEG